MEKLFQNLWAQFFSVTVVFIATLINPAIGWMAFATYFVLWGINFYNSEK